jgi:hypothetical protein
MNYNDKGFLSFIYLMKRGILLFNLLRRVFPSFIY